MRSNGSYSFWQAVAANCAAVREWDSNGTVFGFNKKLSNHQAGEFGHNDFYPVCVAGVEAAREPVDGRTLLRAMICLDEIRGRLAEVFSLRTFKIDHVLHGAIGSAAVYGALVGATAEQVESAIGMLVAHYVPFRAIRSGDQLSDSKGASAALSAEMAVLCMRRAMKGFVGPKDIFRNPESVFRWNVKTPEKESPFDLMLCTEGEDFAVMGMHFKLGLYEHQSAGALELLSRHPEICNSSDAIASVKIVAYEPAFSIIGDKAKRDPQTRQSADHSMVYIVSTLLRKATELEELPHSTAGLWSALILGPHDYSQEAIHHPHTRALMEKVTFVHGGKDYDDLYPEGIPTSVEIVLQDGSHFDSGLFRRDAIAAEHVVLAASSSISVCSLLLLLCFYGYVMLLLATAAFPSCCTTDCWCCRCSLIPSLLPSLFFLLNIVFPYLLAAPASTRMVLFPAGHSRNEEVDLEDLLHHKFRALGALALPKEKVVSTIEKLLSLHRATPQQVQELYAVEGLSPREPIY
ncbi:hypothetical protein ACSSS7_006888 [Eimeria intestinalis]